MGWVSQGAQSSVEMVG